MTSLFKALDLRRKVFQTFLHHFFISAFTNKTLHYDLINSLRTIEEKHHFKTIIAKSGIETVRFEDLFGPINRYELKINRYESDGVTLSNTEITYVCAMAKAIGANRTFEFGTYRGLTTLQLALNTDPDARIITINIPKNELQSLEDCTLDIEKEKFETFDNAMIGEKFKNTDVNYKIEQIIDNSFTYDFSRFHDSMDLIFIDASHRYKYVKHDSENAYDMVKNGGVIVWHDLSPKFPEVVQYLVESSADKKIHHIEDTSLALHRNI